VIDLAIIIKLLKRHKKEVMNGAHFDTGARNYKSSGKDGSMYHQKLMS
jgi:hypothetical protein